MSSEDATLAVRIKKKRAKTTRKGGRVGGGQQGNIIGRSAGRIVEVEMIPNCI